MIFITEKRPDLRIYTMQTGLIQFEDGRYETTDPREIAVLERNRYVTNFSDVERDLTTPSPLDNPLGVPNAGWINAPPAERDEPGEPDDAEDEGDAGRPAAD